jgi:hypothetical protein
MGMQTTTNAKPISTGGISLPATFKVLPSFILVNRRSHFSTSLFQVSILDGLFLVQKTADRTEYERFGVIPAQTCQATVGFRPSQQLLCLAWLPALGETTPVVLAWQAPTGLDSGAKLA